MDKLIYGLAIGAAAVLIVAILGLLQAIPMYFLWNWLMPELFALKTITYWQAWGLCFLCGLLFKSSSSSSSKD